MIPPTPDRLLPCPFCGSIPSFKADSTSALIMCRNTECAACCWVQARGQHPEKKALAAWNRRTAPATARHTMDRLPEAPETAATKGDARP